MVRLLKILQSGQFDLLVAREGTLKITWPFIVAISFFSATFSLDKDVFDTHPR